MFDDFLNHRCNIYHLADEAVNVGYGIATAGTLKAGNEPDISDVPCHFSIRVHDQVKIVQKEPYTEVDGDVKLALSAGIDIRMNDTVEDCSNGLKYRAGVPREIHGGHHMIVTLRREDGEPNAI